MKIIHEQAQKFSLLLGMLVVFSFVVIAAYLLIAWTRGEFSQIPVFVLVILFLLLLLDIFFIINFYRLKITVTDEKIIFGFGILKRKILLEKISEINIEDFKFNRYMGYGIRVGRDKSYGYIARSGKGIRLKVQGKRDFFITSDNPEQLKSMIESAKKI